MVIFTKAIALLPENLVPTPWYNVGLLGWFQVLVKY